MEAVVVVNTLFFLFTCILDTWTAVLFFVATACFIPKYSVGILVALVIVMIKSK